MLTLDERRRPGPCASGPSRCADRPPVLTPQRQLGNDFLQRTGGTPLAPDLRREFEPVMGGDLGDVRIHSHEPSTRALGANAYTLGTDIVFAPGRYQPDTDSGRRLLVHELTHVAQQRGGPARIQAQRPPGSWRVDPDEREAEWMAHRHGSLPIVTSDADITRLVDCIQDLGPLHRADCYAYVLNYRLPGDSLDREPLATRQNIKVHEPIVDPSWSVQLGRYFGKTPPPVPTLPAGHRVVVGLSVDGQLTAGARAAGTYLLDAIVREADQKKAFLPPDRTLNLAVPAIGQILRLTRIGSTLLMVEQVGPIVAGPAPSAGNPPVTASSFTLAGRTYQLDSNWKTDEYAKLRAALDAFPTSTLPPDGLRFQRAAALICPPGAATATCDPTWVMRHSWDGTAKRHVIDIYDAAFREHDRRDGNWPTLYTDLAHEVGHAHDFDVLAKAMARFNTPGTVTLAQRLARLTATRSPSGRSYVESSRTRGMINFRVESNAASRDGDFRKATFADGQQTDATGALSHGITDYSEESWAENYAEFFSLYVADPDLLRTLRPNVFEYFAKRFPR